MRTNIGKRFLAGLCAIAMCLSFLPASVGAVGSQDRSAVKSVTQLDSAATTVPQDNAEKPLRLWYDEPAGDYNQTDYNERWQSWQTQALPIGNGYMGGMIFGGVSSESVQFNEKTLWSGGPGSGGYNFGIGENNIQNAYSNIENIRNQLANGALYLNPNVLENGSTGNGAGFGTYQNFGHLDFTFDNEITHYENYQRWLDLRTATAGVSFVSDGVTYEREYFASYPDRVIAMRFTASSQSAVSFTLGMVSAQGGTAVSSVYNGVGEITLAGTVSDNGMKYESAVRVIADGAQSAVTADGSKVTVSGADSVVILLTAGTDYKNDYPTYRGEDPHVAVVARIETARQKGYDALREAHLKDYQEIFSRVDLDLGHDPEINVPTDELLKAYHAGTYDKQALEVLFFQYGRYLLISSSREGSLPANLQGVWNEDNSAEWCSDYHFNVNIEMNYWPAYVTNMAEAAIPYVEYIDSLRESGRVSAEVYFNIASDEANPENGWMVSTMNNPFGYTGINWSGSWGWHPAGNAWVSDALWEYYEFTQDKQYLQETIYPIIREAAVFWTQALQEKDERLVSSPSYSPENGQLTTGVTYDQSLIWQLYTDVIEASTLLGVDEDLRTLLIQQRSKLDPLHVSQRGTLKEWYDEDAEGFFLGDLQHRHVAHLVGLYPGKLITADQPAYFEAAKATLNERGDSGTGWSRAYKAALWARLLEGDRAYDLLQAQLTRTDSISTNYSVGGTYDNLLDAHPPFQIDGNLGATAAIAEMLLQSQTGAITPLAALPADWSNGAYEGLVARGNFETDAAWSNGGLTKFTVRSGSGNDCTISYPGIGDAEVICNGKSVDVTVTENGNQISFATVKGSEYQITEIPTAPTGGTAVRKGLDEVLVSWNAVADAESYHVYRSSDGENFALIAANVPATTYTDLAAVHVQGITYQYRVAAVSASGMEWRSSEAFSTQWDASVRVNSIDISSPTGVTTLGGAAEEIQLVAAITPADTAIADLEWTITDAAGNSTALATVTQEGLVKASGLPAENQTLIVTASAMDGSGITDQFEILVNMEDVYSIEPTNLLSGLQMTLTQGTAQGYWGDVNLGDTSWLTDGFCGNANNDNSLERFSVEWNSANPIILDVELTEASPVALVKLFERLDDPNNDLNNGTHAITNIEVQASYDSGATYETIGSMTKSESVWKNQYVGLWTIETQTKEPTEYLRFVITGTDNSMNMVIWELEAYDAVETNLFLGETVTLNPGTRYDDWSYGPDYLTDGYIGGPDEDGRAGDRLATKDTPTLGLVIQTDKVPELTTVVVSERIDIVEGYGTRIESASLQYSTDGQTWYDAVVDSVVHQTSTNDIELWVIDGIELPGNACYVRMLMQDTGSRQITLWEYMGYAQKNEPVRSALLDALQKAALCKETDFDETGWSTFQAARSEAITVANSAVADNALMQEKTDVLLQTMDGLDLTLQLQSLSVETSGTLLLGAQRQLKVDAIYDRGYPQDVTAQAAYTSDNAAIVSVTESGLITANTFGTAIITISFGGKSVSVELNVIQDLNGALTVVCGNGGSVTRDAGAPYYPNQKVKLTAVPDAGYRFVNWLIDGTEMKTDTSITVTVGTVQTVEAVFELNPTVKISSPTGVTTLGGATEQIQLVATVTPAVDIGDLEWKITDTAGNATTLAVVTQNGLVKSTGLAAEAQKLIVTATATDGSGISDQFEILVDVEDMYSVVPTNLLSGLQLQLVQGTVQGYWGDINLGDAKWLTDGFCGTANNDRSLERFSVEWNSANPIILDAQLQEASPVAMVKLYERLDDPNNDLSNGTHAITNIEVQASYDGGATYETIGSMTKSESVWQNQYVGLWSMETQTKVPTKYLRFVISGTDNSMNMVIWELEAYDMVHPNLFLGETVTLNPGTQWSETSYGTNYLTDGYIGGPDEDGRAGDRLATSNTPTLGLVVQTDKAPELTTVVVSERIDIVEGFGTRIREATLQYSTDGQNWQDTVIGSVVHQDTTNDIALWVMNGIDLPEDAKYVRALMQDTGSREITLWEFMGYAQKSAPGRSALLEALQEAAGCTEADFSGNGWSIFQTARAEAIAAANSNADDVAMQEKADALVLAMSATVAICENGNEVGYYKDLEQAIAACDAGQNIRLLKNVTDVNVTVTKDLCIDLAGKTLSNVTVAEGATLTLIDTATDDYEGVYGTATVTGTVKTFAEFGGKTYLAVGENNVYSAHCYDVALTHISLAPVNDALGYKAQLYGDEIVQSHVKSFGFNLWLDGGKVKTYGKTGTDVVTLRLKNILKNNGGESNINATAFVVLAVGENTYTKTGTQQTSTMKDTLQTINAAWDTFTATQQAAVKALCDLYPDTVSAWNLTNIYPAA